MSSKGKKPAGGKSTPATKSSSSSSSSSTAAAAAVKPVTLEGFCETQQKLLEEEKETGREEVENLLSTLSPLELQRRGLQLSKVRTGAMRTGLGGRR